MTKMAMPTGADGVAAAKRGEFTAEFPRGTDATAFVARVTQPGWWVADVRQNRKGGRLVTWKATDKAMADRDGEPGWYTTWNDMRLTVGSFGSTFGEPPFGTGRRTAYLNGRPCPAEM